MYKMYTNIKRSLQPVLIVFNEKHINYTFG